MSFFTRFKVFIYQNISSLSKNIFTTSLKSFTIFQNKINKYEGGFIISDQDIILETRGLFKTYYLGKSIQVPALQGIDLIIKKGTFTAIMGPSGSGKSTLMNLIGCLDRPTKGDIIIEGVATSRMSRSELAYIRNKKIGFVFQNFNLLPRANALDNVMLPFIYGDYPKNKRKERAMEVLRAVGLSERWNHKPNELSGGQKQKVAIARALINSPSIILADEPTGNIDSRSGIEVMSLLQRLNEEGMTILCVTHDRFIAEHAEAIINLHDGRISKIEKVINRRIASNELKTLPKDEE